MASRSAGASARTNAAPAPRRAPRRAPAPPRLSVVRAEETTRSVGLLGSAIAVFLFGTLLGLAALHATLVQAQAGLDSIVSENADRREQVDALLAEMAHLDSPEGVAEQALAAGLVAAPEVVTIAPLAPGALAAPTASPFGPRGALVDTSSGVVSG